MTAKLQHPVLGTVLGTKSKDVVQYRGIPFATLAHPFAAPVVKTHYSNPIDATHLGPTVLAPPIGCGIEASLIQKALEKPPVPGPSALEGLNLNITVPEETFALDQGAGLPVLVYIHGGGFLFGGNWAPHYDLANLVSFSSAQGRPIIGVVMNYRLGAPGFLDSEELRAMGIPRNRGLLDQKAALEWLSQNIAGFGGDPGSITVIGQSAGGACVTRLFNFMSDKRLFHKAIAMSGSKLSAAFVPGPVAQDAYGSVLQALKIDTSLSPEEQVSRLISTEPEMLLEIPLTVPMGPVVDDSDFPSFEDLEATFDSQCNVPLMIGSTSFDGGVFELLGLFTNRDEDNLVTEFANIFIRGIDKRYRAVAEKLLDEYDLLPSRTKTTSTAAAQISILQLATDIKFFTAARAYAASWPTRSWLYYFQEPNPWHGPNKGRATHAQDVAYLFLNYRQFMKPREVEVAETFALDALRFVYGEAPWPSFDENGEMRVYGPSQADDLPVRVMEECATGPSLRVRALWDEIGLDELSKGWDAYFLRR